MSSEVEVVDVDASDDGVELDMAVVVQKTTEFSLLDRQEKALKRRKDQLKDELGALLEIEGQADEKGNLLLALPDTCGDIQSLQLQRRVSQNLDGEVAEKILKSIVVGAGTDDEHTLWDDCLEWVPTLHDAKIMAAHFEGLLTEEQVDEMFPESETFAFSPIRIPKSRGR